MDTLEEAELAFKSEFLDGKSMDWINKTNNHSEINNIEESLFYVQMCERMIFIVDDKEKVVGTGCIWGGKMFGND